MIIFLSVMTIVAWVAALVFCTIALFQRKTILEYKSFEYEHQALEPIFWDYTAEDGWRDEDEE